MLSVFAGYKIFAQFQLFDLQAPVSSQCVDRLIFLEGATISQTTVSHVTTDSVTGTGQPATTVSVTSPEPSTAGTESVTSGTVTSGGGSTSGVTGTVGILPQCGTHGTYIQHVHSPACFINACSDFFYLRVLHSCAHKFGKGHGDAANLIKKGLMLVCLGLTIL